MNRNQFDRIVAFLIRMGHDDTPLRYMYGGMPRIPVERKALIFLWYMANMNSFREISDKFNITKSSAHRIISKILLDIHHLSALYIKWPNQQEKAKIAANFLRVSGVRNVIGAIDGCHIRILRPKRHGEDYMNRKGYYSILLQGVCDDQGKFTSVFVGPPGKVHDSRVLRHSEIYRTWEDKFGDHWKLLADTAYICRDYPFLVTPKKDNGVLTVEDLRRNTAISRGRVIIENAFGRLKCRFRRIKDIQNVNLDIAVKLVIAACTLHNLLTGESDECVEHPYGCPRVDDDNE